MRNSQLIPNRKICKFLAEISVVDEVPAALHGIPVMHRETRILLHMLLLVLCASEREQEVYFVEDVLAHGNLERGHAYDRMYSLIPLVEHTVVETNRGQFNVGAELQHWLDYYYELKYSV